MGQGVDIGQKLGCLSKLPERHNFLTLSGTVGEIKRKKKVLSSEF